MYRIRKWLDDIALTWLIDFPRKENVYIRRAYVLLWPLAFVIKAFCILSTMLVIVVMKILEELFKMFKGLWVDN